MSTIDIQKDLTGFGTKMYIITLLLIVNLFASGISEIAIIIVLFLSLKHIKSIYNAIQDENLKKFRSNLRNALYIQTVGYLILVVVMAIIISILVIFLPRGSGELNLSELTLIINVLFGFAIIALIVGMLSAIFMMMGWSDFNTFVINNNKLFVGILHDNLIKGSKLVRRAYLLDMIVYLIGIILMVLLMNFIPSFILAESGNDFSSTNFMSLILVMGIPVAIIACFSMGAFILKIFGYFKLAKLKNITIKQSSERLK